MSHSGDKMETGDAVNRRRPECALVMPQVDGTLSKSRSIAVAPKAASTGAESDAGESAVKETLEDVLKSTEAVKAAPSLVGKAVKLSEMGIEEDPVALPDGTDGTLVEPKEVVQGRTYRRGLTDSEALILYQMLKRRERELQCQIEGGLPDTLPLGGVRDPLLPDLVQAVEAHTIDEVAAWGTPATSKTVSP